MLWTDDKGRQAKPCIGCGWCCRKAPCVYASAHNMVDETGECARLFWNGERWRCQMIMSSNFFYAQLYAGEGCCCPLNDYQRENKVPTPEELRGTK
jgi:hypothetical protein